MLHAAGAVHQDSRENDRVPLISTNWGVIPRNAERSFRGYKTFNAREYDLGSVLQSPLTVRNFYREIALSIQKKKKNKQIMMLEKPLLPYNHLFIVTKSLFWFIKKVLAFLQIGTLRITYTKDPDLEYLNEITKTDMSFYDKAELNAFYRCAGMLSQSKYTWINIHCRVWFFFWIRYIR